MFNFSEVKASLTVTPEVSPSILKDYVKDVDLPNAVFGRSKGQWVELSQEYESLRVGFSLASSISSLTEHDYDAFLSLNKIAFAGQDAFAQVSNDDAEKTLWICSQKSVSGVTYLDGNIPVSITEKGSLSYDEKSYFCYSVSGLSAGDYKFLIHTSY